VSRSRHFIHAVWSGYLLTFVVSAISLLTIRIALSVLGKPLFGLWCAVASVTLVATIFDLGIGPSLSRFLTDYKDRPDKRTYADFLKSVVVLGSIQGTAFVTIALTTIPFLPELMKIPAEQQAQFKQLMLLQMVPIALGFPLRFAGQVLYSNQRIAIVNGCGIAGNLVNAAVLVTGLYSGLGIYSYVAGVWSSFLVMNGGLLFFSNKLGLIPNLRSARVSFSMLKPLMKFSANVLVIVAGTQLIAFAPGLLISRKLGVQTLADWTVGTRLLTFVTQLITRIPNSSEPAFWEMFSRGEVSRLGARMLDLIAITGSAAAFFAAGIVAVNPAFVTLLSGGHVVWHTSTDLSLVAWLFVLSMTLVLNMTPGITKYVGAMKYAYLLQGLCLAGLAVTRQVRFESVLAVGVLLLVSELAFRFNYGFWRTGVDLKLSFGTLFKPVAKHSGIFIVLMGLGLGVHFIPVQLAPVWEIFFKATIYGLFALPILLLVGLPPEIKRRIRELGSNIRTKIRGITPG